MKCCIKCFIEKDNIHFKQSKHTRDKLTSSCRLCISAYEKEKYRLNKIANGGRNPKNLICREIKRKYLEGCFSVGFECDI